MLSVNLSSRQQFETLFLLYYQGQSVVVVFWINVSYYFSTQVFYSMFQLIIKRPNYHYHLLKICICLNTMSCHHSHRALSEKPCVLKQVKKGHRLLINLFFQLRGGAEPRRDKRIRVHQSQDVVEEAEDKREIHKCSCLVKDVKKPHISMWHKKPLQHRFSITSIKRTLVCICSWK